MFAPLVGGPKKMLSLLVTPLDKNINTDYKMFAPEASEANKYPQGWS